MRTWARVPQQWRSLAASRPGSVLLETARFSPENQHSYLYLDPVRVLTAETPEAVSGFLRALDEAVAGGLHAAGYLSYECGYGLLPAGPARMESATRPLAWFGLYRAPIVLHHATGRVEGALPEAVKGLDGLGESGESKGSESIELAVSRPLARSVALEISQREYGETVERIQEYIRAGDTYQVNWTDRVRVQTDLPADAAYASLLRQQPVAYAALVHPGGRRILSLSPELFFSVDSGQITTRPMKGTLARGLDADGDAAAAERLRQDEKNCSEHVMIVDLLRNDLGRICTPGSVQVEEMFAVERYATLLQMTSKITGRLLAGMTYADIFASLFPSGSITGAPKIRTMQIIAELERQARGVYTGAIGHITPGGRATFNVAIRTLVLEEHGAAQMGVGGGIVADSNAAAEYQECLLKAAFLTRCRPEFELIETMLWREGEICLLAQHLERLAASAAYLDFAWEREAVAEPLRAYCATLPTAIPHRVRLLLNESGKASITSAPLEPEAWRGRIRLAAERTRSDDVFLRHKTTHRFLYERELARARAEGFDEVLFLNERGEVTEGAISNLFIEREGRLLTPPLACGLLPGVLRRHLLATRPEAEERVLRLEDVRSAEAIYLGSALRGLRKVDLQHLLTMLCD
jgi:para-aminobenzoate synthetase/4-amino-4-deoxychorismate lyase